MKRYIIILVTIFALIGLFAYMSKTISKLRVDRDLHKANSEILLDDVEYYRINDSINVAQCGMLRLKNDELKRYRADDALLISKLKGDVNSLAHLTSVQANTISNFKGTVRDSIVYVDTLPPRVIKCIDVKNHWYTINGCIEGDSIKGVMNNRESIKIVDRIKYARFLGFLWKTNKIKSRKTDAFSLNPNTRIENLESIIIEE